MGVQCTSVRLLLNLVEVMHARRADVRAQETHRLLLARSLEACVARLSALCRALPHLLRNGAFRTPMLLHTVQSCTYPVVCSYSHKVHGKWLFCISSGFSVALA